MRKPVPENYFDLDDAPFVALAKGNDDTSVKFGHGQTAAEALADAEPRDRSFMKGLRFVVYERTVHTARHGKYEYQVYKDISPCAA